MGERLPASATGQGLPDHQHQTLTEATSETHLFCAADSLKTTYLYRVGLRADCEHLTSRSCP